MFEFVSTFSSKLLTRRLRVMFHIKFQVIDVASLRKFVITTQILIQDLWVVSFNLTPQQFKSMEEAWMLLRRIRSNTILIWDGVNGITLGIGSGQGSRVGAAHIALQQAGNKAGGAILASDSFFPFSDTVQLAAEYGITAIVQQGGSINDQASIDAADNAGMAMVLTGERAFWH